MPITKGNFKIIKFTISKIITRIITTSIGFPIIYSAIVNIKSSMNISSYIFNSSDGMVIFYDDRTGGSAGELVEQDMLTIIIKYNHTITTIRSKRRINYTYRFFHTIMR